MSDKRRMGEGRKTSEPQGNFLPKRLLLYKERGTKYFKGLSRLSVSQCLGAVWACGGRKGCLEGGRA